MKKLTAIFCAAAMLAACSSGQSTDATDTPNSEEPVTEEIIESHSGTSLEKTGLIADYITEQASGLAIVTYTEIPEHTRSDGSPHYGVHYNLLITKRADSFSAEDRKEVERLAGEIFRLTAKYIMEPASEDLSHMGVQIVDPDIWFFQGHPRGSAAIYIASRQDLLSLSPAATSESYFNVARENRETLIFTETLESIIELAREAQSE